jgi:hypothetical protein
MTTAKPLIAPGDIIVGAWINFRTNLAVYAEFAVWFVLLSIVRWALGALVHAYVDDRMLSFGIELLFALPVLFGYAVLTVALIQAVAKHVRGKPAGVGESVSAGFGRVFSAIWVSILAGLLIALGLAALVIPGIFFIVCYRFAQDFAVVDEQKGGEAMRSSRKLVSGRWWATFGRLIVPFLFFFVAVQFVTYLSYLVAGAALGDPSAFFGQFTAVQELPRSQMLIANVLLSIIDAFALPLFLASDLILWFDLKRSA